MCGIAGIAGLKDAFARRAKVEAMTAQLAHRGPDASGIFDAAAVSLGHRRLSIIDLSDSANQPMTDTTGRFTVVFNGQLYNFRDLRQLLPDYPFRTSSDTEVLLAAFGKWGPGCTAHFNGMFAFAVWDRAEQSLFVCRDRMGIKPLYYAERDGAFFFSSEMRALLHGAGLPRCLSENGLLSYLAFQAVHPPDTLVEGISQLRPGEYAVWKNGTLEKHRYWEAGTLPPIGDDPAQAAVKVRELLQAAVARRLVSDVPLGAFLSGGIDSSAIVALMATASAEPVQTFSVVFEEKVFDESPYSDMVARRYRTNHHPILLRPVDFLEALPTALAAMDTPSGDAINTYVVAKVTKAAGITVALSGLGGDELFMGYSPYLQTLRLMHLPLVWRLPRSLRKLLVHAAGLFVNDQQQAKLLEIAGAGGPEVEHVFPAFRKVLTDVNLRAMGLRPPALNGYVPLRPSLPQYSRLTLADLALYTRDVLLKDSDQMSMAHALEVRVPFFDHTLVEYVLRIPDHSKHPTYPKKLLAEAMGDLLPKEIVFRKKQGFDLPWKVWMKNELRPYCEAKLNSLCGRGLFHSGAIRQLWQTFSAGGNDTLWSRVWVLVVLEDWMQRHLD